MRLCFDATRFGLGLKEAVEMAAAKGLAAVEFSFEAFDPPAKAALSPEEKEYLAAVRKSCDTAGVEIACLRLDFQLDPGNAAHLKQFRAMTKQLALLANKVGCQAISFNLKPGVDEGWVATAGEALSKTVELLSKSSIKLVLSASTPAQCRGLSLRRWRPLEMQEIRDLIAHCPGLSLSFSAADAAWQSIDYLQVLPGLMPAIEHVEANDFEINRALLADSGLFGPLWWRYRRPGKGQLDWAQLIEALKLYDYHGSLSIHLDDEFVESGNGGLEDALDESVKLLKPLLKY